MIKELVQNIAFTWESLPAILKGLSLTLEVIFISIGTGFILGVPIALLEVYGWKVVSALMYVYERILRGIPVMFTIFLIYFGAPAVGLNFSAFVSGLLALGLRSSAYQSQIFRGSIQSVGKGQLLAADSLGMSWFKIITKIVLPQAIRRAIPAWSNEWSTMVKDSSLVYVIGVVEMMTRTKMIVDRTGKVIPLFLTVALIYLVITTTGNKLLRILEEKVYLPGVTTRRET